MQLHKFEDIDFKYDNSFFLILTQKDPNEAYLVLHLGIFIFSEGFVVRQDKLEVADFTYDNSFSKIVTQKDPNKALLAQYSDSFLFSQNLAIRQIRVCLFQI